MFKHYHQTWRVSRDRYLNTHEIKSLFDECKKQEARNNLWKRIWMLVHLAFCTGLRVGEISNLKIGDLILDDTEPRLHVRNGKTRNSRRYVPLPQELRLHLQEYIAEFLPSVFQSNLESDYLFQSSRQSKYSVSGLQHLFKIAFEAVGLGHYSAHCCRHSFAFTYYGKTKDLRGLQILLGHSDLSTTEVYTVTPFSQLHKNCEALY